MSMTLTQVACCGLAGALIGTALGRPRFFMGAGLGSAGAIYAASAIFGPTGFYLSYGLTVFGIVAQIGQFVRDQKVKEVASGRFKKA